jgi:hypothetical protein
MRRRDEATFVIHGLAVDNLVVRAAVFIQKLGILLRALQEADKLANGRASFDFMLSRLEEGSAAATIREKQRRREPPRSSIETFESVALAVYNGEQKSDRTPPNLVKYINKLGQGVALKFSHAEIAFADDNVIRIDDFLVRQSEVAYEFATLPDAERQFYRGLAIGSFDGILKEIDARGIMLRGKLVLVAGVEIDCVMNKGQVPEARESFDKRVIVDGVAHYDGVSQLPTRLDVKNIKIVSESPDLLRWRGAFEFQQNEEDEDG